MTRTHLHKEEVNPIYTHVWTALVLCPTAMGRLIYNAVIKHAGRCPQNDAKAPQPTVIFFVSIHQQELLTTVINLALCCIKGIFFKRDNLGLEKVVAVLDDPVLQYVVAANVGKTVIEWERLGTLKVRERRKQQYLLLKCMCVTLITQ